MGRILLAVLGIYLLVTCGRITGGGGSRPPEASPIASPPAVVNPSPPTRDTSWRRYETIDTLSGKPEVSMQLESLTVHKFDFPHAGGSVLSLVVRKHPRYGNDVFIHLSKGQLTCTYGACTVGWRVDQNPIRYPAATKPQDGSSDVFFLGSAAQLTKELSAGKRLIVETSVYTEGSRQWEFNVEGFVKP